MAAHQQSPSLETLHVTSYITLCDPSRIKQEKAINMNHIHYVICSMVLQNISKKRKTAMTLVQKNIGTHIDKQNIIVGTQKSLKRLVRLKKPLYGLERS